MNFLHKISHINQFKLEIYNLLPTIPFNYEIETYMKKPVKKPKKPIVVVQKKPSTNVA
jgi:hypothetical protein